MNLEKVMLWLGANVMLEYDIDEADTLLSNNKTNAIKSLEEVKEQLGKSKQVVPIRPHIPKVSVRIFRINLV